MTKENKWKLVKHEKNFNSTYLFDRISRIQNLLAECQYELTILKREFLYKHRISSTRRAIKYNFVPINHTIPLNSQLKNKEDKA